MGCGAHHRAGHGRAEADRVHPQPAVGRLLGGVDLARAAGVGPVGEQ